MGGTRDDAEENEHLASLLPLPPDFVEVEKEMDNCFLFFIITSKFQLHYIHSVCIPKV